MPRPIGKVTVQSCNWEPAVWNDLATAASATGVGAANAPAFQKNFDNGAGSIGLFQRTFSAGTRNDVFMEVHLPHGWLEGSEIEVHFHWVPLNNNGGNIVWEFEYIHCDESGLMGNSTLVTPITVINAGANVGRHEQTFLTVIPKSSKKISSFIVARLSRLAADVGDTYTGECAFLGMDCHIQLDALGSEEEEKKYK